MTRQVSYVASRGPGHTPAPIGALLRATAADLSVLATFASVAGLFLISAYTLEVHGIAYLTSGGGIFAKLHPSTFAAVAALALRCLASSRPAHTAWRLSTADGGVVLLVAALLGTAGVAITVARQPFTPLVDTFLLPCFVFVLLRDLHPTLLRWLAMIVIALLVANAVIALAELSTGWHLVKADLPDDVSSDPTRPDVEFSWMAGLRTDWRATALLGHPLINGLVVGIAVVCLLARGARWIPIALGLPLAALQYISLFAFGARAAMVFTAVIGAFVLLQRIAAGIAEGRRMSRRFLVVLLGAGIVAIIGLGLLVDAGIFDRAINRFSDDAGSAETRRTMFELFNDIPWSDLVLVPDPDQVATLQKFYGLEFGIESSWLGLALSYGLVVTTCLTLGLFAFARSVVKRSGSGAVAAFLLYFILVSVAANLTTKVTTLAMTVCIVMLFLPRFDQRKDRLEEATWH